MRKKKPYFKRENAPLYRTMSRSRFSYCRGVPEAVIEGDSITSSSSLVD
jgi:hypothetical protein